VSAPVSGPWPAPAKLNLFLHIVGRRPDGYHLLQTVFQLLDYGDRLYFEPTPDGRIERIGELAGVAPEDDLCLRAARRLQDKAGTGQGARIRLDKRLPLGGGLGGGSSDAATTLVALNRLWGLGLDAETLAGIGLELGADVPVFVHGRSAWAEGVGERLSPVALPDQWFLVVDSGVRVSTARLFQDPELTRDSPHSTIADFAEGRCINAFEPVLRRRQPEIAAALDWLAEHAPARLTGTGGCVFAGFAEEAVARQALAGLPAGWRGFVARGCDRSPLYTDPPA
jgi:4-diphosphocytidyl-2-C-methyl-D-erythritol kinase